MEFAKDVDDLQAMRAALEPNPQLKTEPVQWFYCFDEDNVVLGKSAVNSMDGELTGKKGDAMRLYINFPSDHRGNTRKVEARPAEKKLAPAK